MATSLMDGVKASQIQLLNGWQLNFMEYMNRLDHKYIIVVCHAVTQRRWFKMSTTVMVIESMIAVLYLFRVVLKIYEG